MSTAPENVRIASRFGPASAPSRSISVTMAAARAQSAKPQGEGEGVDLGLLGPAGHREPAAAGIEGERDPAWVGGRSLTHQGGLADRSGAEDDSRHPPLEPALDRGVVADAAAELHWDRDRGQNRLDRRGIDGPPGDRAVEIDQVEPTEAEILEATGLVGRVGIVGRRARHIAAQQADTRPPFEIDRRVNDHGRCAEASAAPRAFVRRLRTGSRSLA